MVRKMKILILGGTGFIGSKVVNALRNHEIILFHRNAAHLEKFDSSVRHIIGDRKAINKFSSQFKKLQPDVVLDMIAQNGEDVEAVSRCLTGATERVVVISSGSAYRKFGIMIGTEIGEIDNCPSSEHDSLRENLFPYRNSDCFDSQPEWLLNYDKILAERMYQNSELRCNVVRLPMIYGPGDPDNRLDFYLKRMLDNRSTILLREQVAQWRNSRSYVDNAASAIAHVVLHGTSPVYNISEPQDYSELEWIKLIAHEVGWQGQVRILPNEARLGRPPIDELPIITNFAQHMRLDSSLIRSELGYSELVTAGYGIRATVNALSASLPIDYADEDAYLNSMSGC
jgi:nucleoside-diphosphate-sugar epimerase